MQRELTTTEVKKVFQKKLLSHKMIQFWKNMVYVFENVYVREKGC